MKKLKKEKQGFSAGFGNDLKQACAFFYQSMQKEDTVRQELAGQKLRKAVKQFLDELT